jgi:hypothetical protein
LELITLVCPHDCAGTEGREDMVPEDARGGSGGFIGDGDKLQVLAELLDHEHAVAVAQEGGLERTAEIYEPCVHEAE